MPSRLTAWEPGKWANCVFVFAFVVHNLDEYWYETLAVRDDRRTRYYDCLACALCSNESGATTTPIPCALNSLSKSTGAAASVTIMSMQSSSQSGETDLRPSLV